MKPVVITNGYLNHNIRPPRTVYMGILTRKVDIINH